jgi:hypothetical protein
MIEVDYLADVAIGDSSSLALFSRPVVVNR